MSTVKLVRALPAPALRPYVRHFQQREATVTERTVVYPISARAEQLLEFYLQDRYRVRSRVSGAIGSAARSVVVGPSTCRAVELVLLGRFDVFTVHFQPSGFHQLFGMHMSELADRCYEARAVIGPLASAMEQRLADAPTFQTRVDIATRALLRRAHALATPNAVARAANRVLLHRGTLRIPETAAGVGLSVRQFERTFQEQVGITPRLYARIVRFQAAVDARMSDAHRSWADIAHDLGYYDQMHMVHDFRQFSDDNPTRFLETFHTMPVRW
jgi:AraC-like DNA-binding protein